jgi:hypothetical protein
MRNYEFKNTFIIQEQKSWFVYELFLMHVHQTNYLHCKLLHNLYGQLL